MWEAGMWEAGSREFSNLDELYAFASNPSDLKEVWGELYGVLEYWAVENPNRETEVSYDLSYGDKSRIIIVAGKWIKSRKAFDYVYMTIASIGSSERTHQEWDDVDEESASDIASEVSKLMSDDIKGWHDRVLPSVAGSLLYDAVDAYSATGDNVTIDLSHAEDSMVEYLIDTGQIEEVRGGYVLGTTILNSPYL